MGNDMVVILLVNDHIMGYGGVVVDGRRAVAVIGGMGDGVGMGDGGHGVGDGHGMDDGCCGVNDIDSNMGDGGCGVGDGRGMGDGG